jgi:short-subunit dehydrogenase
VSKRVLITGAAGGIGEATADALRRRGCTVAGLDLNADGDDIIACDVRDQDSVDEGVAAAVERLGGFDVLINSAGVGDPQSAAERPDDDALRVLTLVRAALDPVAHRDLATSRQGAVGYAIFRHIPRRVLDRRTARRLRDAARRGQFDDSELAAELRGKLTEA